MTTKTEPDKKVLNEDLKAFLKIEPILEAPNRDDVLFLFVLF